MCAHGVRINTGFSARTGIVHLSFTGKTLNMDKEIITRSRAK